MEAEKINPDVFNKVNDYVRKNYKSFDVKGELIIDDLGPAFMIKKAQDTSPLFLDKSIL
jgi:hypothetical protein